jgi:ankyrin repeat protein
MTLMELAVTQAWESAPKDSTPSGATPLDVVRELLSLGADPNPGLEIATKTRDVAVISALLAAGAKPDYANDHGPVVFEWIAVTPVANFTALLDHKLDVNVVDRSGTPLVIAAAEHDRWDLVLLLMARGADATRAATNGTHLSDVVQSRVESTTDRPAEMKADIARVKAQLSGPAARTSR